MEPSLTVKTVSSLEKEISLAELKYQKALKSGAVFKELKEIRQEIRQLKTELEWKRSFPLEHYKPNSLSGFD